MASGTDDENLSVAREGVRGGGERGGRRRRTLPVEVADGVS